MESSASVHLRAANSQIQVSCATLAGQPLDVSFVKRCVYRARRLLYSGGGPAIVWAALGPWRTPVPAIHITSISDNTPRTCSCPEGVLPLRANHSVSDQSNLPASDSGTYTSYRLRCPMPARNVWTCEWVRLCASRRSLESRLRAMGSNPK